VKRAAIYGRVSTDHYEQQESINVQKSSLLEYAVQEGFSVMGSYFDEGYSGTNFDRPGIKKIKADIENGNIDTIIVKDLSRIGRNNALTLLFLDYLAQNNIRIIAIDDNYDSFEDNDDLVGIKTWFNERYSKELSRKIKYALRHKKKVENTLPRFHPMDIKSQLNTKIN
jgi:DNA invertase Pin-like site-specific DNA recombinase